MAKLSRAKRCSCKCSWQVFSEQTGKGLNNWEVPIPTKAQDILHTGHPEKPSTTTPRLPHSCSVVAPTWGISLPPKDLRHFSHKKAQAKLPDDKGCDSGGWRGFLCIYDLLSPPGMPETFLQHSIPPAPCSPWPRCLQMSCDSTQLGEMPSLSQEGWPLSDDRFQV